MKDKEALVRGGVKDKYVSGKLKMEYDKQLVP